ncbi:hypothetical protein NLI96_g1441 [Meripilus lineatus]|uniref:Uncharacterized protein n=1 Tax=Meripilus lineatus TaxID=2056292 RepID=A0AAD5VCW3_9APHY|nr:hypothetical protein NLI96_g1441 [Physisporinus lineatus]
MIDIKLSWTRKAAITYPVVVIMVVDEHTGHGQKVSNMLTGTDQENQKYPRRRVVIGWFPRERVHDQVCQEPEPWVSGRDKLTKWWIVRT